MRNLTTNEQNAVAGGPAIIIDPDFKSNDASSESVPAAPEADTTRDSNA